ncbi:SusF/SusE family outer membrane protein, partial [bacterium]|nr:SusF/SusE family outer membrane protein [bacterium]
ATVYTEDGKCICSIPGEGYPGSYTYDIQLIQAGFDLQPTHMYRLSYDVKADAERSYGLFLGEVGGGWNSMIGFDKYYQTATTEWQTVTIDFKTPLIFPLHKLSFELGTIAISMYFDNISLTDLGPYTPSVGIIGSSLTGWDTDVDMMTSDGIHYTLNQYLSTGRVKFRQDDTWWINWGGTDFPVSTGSLYGPDILVTNPGTYEIAFNRVTLEYSFTCVDNCTAFVGIAGTAVSPYNNWETDVNMTTFDGVNYILSGYLFTDGEAKFRKNDSWTENWSNSVFPSGTAISDGPAIPIAAGSYTVTFNIVTGEYSFLFPSVGILGDALPGWWYEDIDMETPDGIMYTLTNQEFWSGYVKFRQDNTWDINWGSTDFPAGYGYAFGPDIPIPAGTYSVTFNRLTGEYAFAATSCPIPEVQCPDFTYALS